MPLVVLLHHPYVAITDTGMAAFALLTMRVSVTVSLAVLLTMSTPWHRLLAAMRSLKAPSIFVALMAMTYRYITVLMQIADDMFTARKSRTVGRVLDDEARRFVGSGIGVLFSKTLALTDEVISAMTARGYTGEIKVLSQSIWNRRDKMWVTGAFVIAVALSIGAHLHG
jgi:energy-coupling factor transporter transmembrane protein EcfT